MLNEPRILSILVNLLKTINLDNLKQTLSHMDPNQDLNSEEDPVLNPTDYKRDIGSLKYLLLT